MTGVLLCLKRSILTKICAKSESVVTGMEHEGEDEQLKKEYEQHPCRSCIWSNWQSPYLVSCLFPRCVKEGKPF